MIIGDYFPEKERANYVKRHIRTGAVLKLNFKNINHPKFIIIIGIVRNYVGYIFINSEINENVFRDNNLRELNYLLKKDDYKFLKYDSYAGCLKIYEMEIEKLFDIFSNNMGIYEGKISRIHIKNIMNILKKSPVISRKLKKTYLVF